MKKDIQDEARSRVWVRLPPAEKMDQVGQLASVLARKVKYVLVDGRLTARFGLERLIQCIQSFDLRIIPDRCTDSRPEQLITICQIMAEWQLSAAIFTHPSTGQLEQVDECLNDQASPIPVPLSVYISPRPPLHYWLNRHPPMKNLILSGGVVISYDQAQDYRSYVNLGRVVIDLGYEAVDVGRLHTMISQGFYGVVVNVPAQSDEVKASISQVERMIHTIAVALCQGD